MRENISRSSLAVKENAPRAASQSKGVLDILGAALGGAFAPKAMRTQTVESGGDEALAPWWSVSGRPNGAGRAWLRQSREGMQRRSQPWSGRSGRQVLMAAAGSLLLASLIRRARSRGPLSLDAGRRYAKALGDLPVFFSLEFCAWWEDDKPWMEPGFAAPLKESLAYAEMLSSERPSEAYVLDSGPALEMFARLAAKGDAEKLACALESSAGSLMSGLKSAGAPAPWSVIAAAASELGLDEERTRAWMGWAMWARESSELGGVARLAISDAGFEVESAFAWAMEAMGSGSSAASWGWAGFGPDGLGLRPKWPLSLEEGFGDDALCVDFESLDLAGARWEDGSVAGYPAFEMELGARGNWTWAEGFAQAAKAISGRSASVWIGGPDGSGRSDLARALAAASGKAAVKKRAGSGTEGLSRALRWAGALGLAVLEQSEAGGGGAREAVEAAERAGAALIWVEGSKNEGSGAARAFGFHFSTGALALEQRLACAKTLFADEAIALKAARALRLPGDMAALSKAMEQSEEKSWEWAQAWMAAREKAIEGEKPGRDKSALVAASSRGGSIVGCPELVSLLERAKAAFEAPDGMGAFRGALLVGPPGTGKTMFARELARRCGARLLAPSTGDLAKEPANMAKAFAQARAMAPCIMVLDEADALLAEPEGMFGVDALRQERVNALIAQLDGVEPLEGVFVVATSHREFVPDKAATRAGRLSEVVSVPLPDKEGRGCIWRQALAESALDGEDYDALARASAGFSGAEIAEVARRAPVLAGEKDEGVAKLLSECDRMFWGAASAGKIADSERRVTSVHEAGHAFAAWGAGLEVVRACARPGAGGYLGMVHIEREDGRESMAPGEWRQRIAVSLAGIAAEKLVFGAFTNGGGSDLANSTGLIAMALRKWGWSSRGPVCVPSRDESEALKSWLEDEAADMSRKIFAGVESWLGERREMLMAFAGELEARRELSGPSLASWRETVVSGGALILDVESEGAQRSGAFGQEWSKQPFATLHRE